MANLHSASGNLQARKHRIINRAAQASPGGEYFLKGKKGDQAKAIVYAMALSRLLTTRRQECLRKNRIPMKHLLSVLLFGLLYGQSWAATVTPQAAQQVALQCYERAALRQGLAASSSLQLMLTVEGQRLQEATPLYYVFAPEAGSGFVLVAAEDRVLPVLGYSLTAPFVLETEQQPEAFRKWMGYYQWQIQRVIAEDLPGSDRIDQLWAAYRNGEGGQRSPMSVDPLLTTKWDQPFPYNALCPQDPNTGQRAVVGCVATAMAQIMRYHAHPQQGTGFHSYNHPQFGTVSANFGATTYNWAAMPNTISNYNEEVARVSFHCGVSIEMGYGTDVSGVSSLSGVANALVQYFSYNGSTTQFVERQQYSDANWLQLMRSELDEGRPVEYAGIGQGGGHAWVMDGYDGDFFHMNWGWSGFQDGYFTLNNLNPSTGGTGAGNSGYNNFQQAVIGIQPAGGGGGGGGNPPTQAYADLEVYSNVFLTPFPVQFGAAFDIEVDVANVGTANVSGEIGAAIFTEDGSTFIDFADIISGTLENGFFYNLTFSSDGLPTSPGTYLLGLFYRPQGGEWSLIPPGDFANPVAFEIEGPDNDIQLYAPVAPSVSPIVQGQNFEVSLDYANFGAFDYSGDFSIDLYTLEGEYLAELSSFSGDLCANCHFTNGITYTVDGIDVAPGTYLIAAWNRPQGGGWQLVGNGEYRNPIQVQVAAPAIQADSYENNNATEQAHTVSLSFGGNSAQWNTVGANMHTAEDQDYYRLSLSPGYSYTIEARLHDSYNSGNGQAYTNDVLFGIYDGSAWSELYDDVMPQPFTTAGGTDIVLGVSPYFVGTLGTYQLEVNVSRSPASATADLKAGPALRVGPNPSPGGFDITLRLPEAKPVQLQVQDLHGRVLRQQALGTHQALNHHLDLEQLPAGAYLLRFDLDGQQLQQRLIVTH